MEAYGLGEPSACGRGEGDQAAEPSAAAAKTAAPKTSAQPQAFRVQRSISGPAADDAPPEPPGAPEKESAAATAPAAGPPKQSAAEGPAARTPQQSPPQGAETQAAAGVGQGTPTPVPPTITHTTLAHAPSGAADDRTTVAVGERIRFESSASGRWSADSVQSRHAATGRGTRYTWYAPVTAGTATITFTPAGGGAPIATTITVIAPTVEYLNPRQVASPGEAPGVSGVSMETDVFYTPDTVSFSRTWWWEQPGPATGATGYFAGMTLPYHHPTARDLPIASNNSGIYDTAGFWGFPAPYSNGFFEWVIPTFYKVTGESTRHLITNVHQTCTMAPDGTMTVSKGGSASVSRTP